MDLSGVLTYVRNAHGSSIIPPLTDGTSMQPSVRVHAARLLSASTPNLRRLLVILEWDSRTFGLNTLQDHSFVLVAHSEEEKVELEGLVRTMPEIARWRSVFAVELEV